MSEPKKHHYLSQFYLEGFQISSSGKVPQIFVYDKHSTPLKSFISAIKDTGCQRDYHTFENQDNERDRVTVESILSTVETEQSLLIDKIIKSKNYNYG